MTDTLPDLTIILGGARSGKSAFAERLAGLAGLEKVYIATAVPFDDEMETRIAEHRVSRGEGWLNIEAPDELPDALKNAPDGAVVLVDCLTLWLTNRMMSDADIEAETGQLLDAVELAGTPVIMVSNELGMGLVPEGEFSRKFRDAQGRLNQRIADRASLAVFVVAGQPLVMKGQLPEGAI